MGSWYWIGVSVGIGVGVGVFGAGFWRSGRNSPILVTLLSIAFGVGFGSVILDRQLGTWADRIGGVAGVVLGLLGAIPVVVGALRRGGTRGGTVTLLAAAALVLAALAFVPALGYVEAIVLPVLAALLRRRRPERYAGLRTLAKD